MVSICSYSIAVAKIQSIQSKENLVTVSAEKDYELAKNYRMNPIFRTLGVGMGLIFVLFPVLICFNTTEEISELGMGELFMIGLFLIATPLMGIMFLTYAIPGKTPSFILKQMEKKINMN